MPIFRPREIMKQIGACKWRPDARAISVRHVCRFGKKSVIASQIFPRRGRFYSPAKRTYPFAKWRTLKINLLGKKGRLMKRRSTFLYHSGRSIPAFLTELIPTTKTKINAPICFTISRGRQIGTTNCSV